IPGTPYSQTAVELGSQDIIVLYTDGVTEFRNPKGETLGQLGLLSLARGLPLDSPVRIGQAVLSAVRTFRDALPAEDDETVIGNIVRGTRAPGIRGLWRRRSHRQETLRRSRPLAARASALPRGHPRVPLEGFRERGH